VVPDPNPTHLLEDVSVLPREVGEEEVPRLAEQMHLELLLPVELDKVGRVHAEDVARVVEVGAVVLDEGRGEVAPGIEGVDGARGTRGAHRVHARHVELGAGREGDARAKIGHGATSINSKYGYGGRLR
jgi:hypothetical protein